MGAKAAICPGLCAILNSPPIGLGASILGDGMTSRGGSVVVPGNSICMFPPDPLPLKVGRTSPLAIASAFRASTSALEGLPRFLGCGAVAKEEN